MAFLKKSWPPEILKCSANDNTVVCQHQQKIQNKSFRFEAKRNLKRCSLFLINLQRRLKMKDLIRHAVCFKIRRSLDGRCCSQFMCRLLKIQQQADKNENRQRNLKKTITAKTKSVSKMSKIQMKYGHKRKGSNF